MDFIEGLPKTHGFDVILVVVDRLSKYSRFMALKHPYTARFVSDIFIKEIVRLHIEGLPKPHGFDVILVVVDRLSKNSHFMALKHPYIARSVADIFIKEIVHLHGFPKSIVSDRDKDFMSHFWQMLFWAAGTRLHHSSAYHPHQRGELLFGGISSLFL